MMNKKFYARSILAAAISLFTASQASAAAYTWVGTTSSDIGDTSNWTPSPGLSVTSGMDQGNFGATIGSTTVLLASGGDQITYLGPDNNTSTANAINFLPGAPAYTFTDGGDSTKKLRLYINSSSAGHTDILNDSGSKQTFNVNLIPTRSTIEARSGDIEFAAGKTFNVANSAANNGNSVIFKGDDDIYLLSDLLGNASGIDRSRIFYSGASTTAANAGKLYLGNMTTTYVSRIVIDSTTGGAVVATTNNAFGGNSLSNGGSDTYIGAQNLTNGANTNGRVELNADIDGTPGVADYGNLTIPENFRLEGRVAGPDKTHIRNVIGNNTISGFIAGSGNSITFPANNNFYIDSLAGTLTIAQGIDANQPGPKNMFFGGEGDGILAGSGLIASAGTAGGNPATSSWNIIKQGTGTWTNAAVPTAPPYPENSGITGTTTIEAGTYNMNSSHTVGGDYIVGPSTAANLALHGGTIVSSGNLNVGTGNVTVDGTSSLTFNNMINSTGAGAIAVNAGGTMLSNNLLADTANISGSATIRANGGAAGASKVETLTMSGTGKLDLKDNDLVVGTGTIAAVRAQIKLGVGGVSGITSDAAGFSVTTGFGYAEGDDAALSPLLAGSLTGQTYDADSVLVKYTYLGDADLDGDSDLNDLGLWAQSFTGDLGNPAIPATFWTSGDFDYDGDTDLNDLGFWAGTFTGDLGGGTGSLIVIAPSAPAGAVAALNGMGITVVPEPSTFILAGLGAVGLTAIGLRRRKN